MHCPSCQRPTFEAAPSCPACGFSLAAADLIFGVPPVLSPGVIDLVNAFSPGEKRRVQAAIDGMQKRFPQIRFTVLVAALDDDTPLGTYAFWVFNRSGICPEIERGSTNHSILLTVDTTNYRANLTIGYGLEPFIGGSHLNHALSAGLDNLSKGRLASGVRDVIASTGDVLARVASGLDQTYGIRVGEIYRKEAPQR